MRRSLAVKRSLAAGIAAGLLMTGLAAMPALAQGDPVGGRGSMYYLNDAFTGSANTVFGYGGVEDVVYFGDWDGNGRTRP
ncbi:hypothetical protein [Agromyces aerolatus]|uniref:hypothetical protein n=1 Tax=Agromyces sp. LY-1074 TaxID=3074080 RepID=UPI00285A73C7|nr:MULTISPECIES: hypothetical protein [unclassified Agromyces]MDR5698996.1 hypothetical protein [Agromyces sp. LY-1074]MDR5705226.1 hypothetical protein [Agromyces sp. LY-1358]